MKILWFTWKDLKHPEAGGAEFINEELAKRLVKDGHELIFLVGGFVETRHRASVQEAEKRDGFRIIRLGNRFSVYWYAYKYYRKNLIGWADLVIDEINTIPFFAKQYVEEKNILFIHQLAREIWFYQIFFPLNIIGYLLEPIYLWFLRDRKVITVSESTKKDLLKYGFKKENINIISEGIGLTPVEKLENKKYKVPTILSLGSVRPMKRTLDIVEAFEIAKVNIPNLRLKIAGDMNGLYGEKVKKYINKSRYKNDIELYGRVNDSEKLELMRKSHILVMTSIKEGWGLTVTESASQGTPAIVYNVDGLRDSVRHNQTGLICKFNKPDYLALSIINIFSDKNIYYKLRENAWEWSKNITLEKAYQDFIKIISYGK